MRKKCKCSSDLILVSEDEGGLQTLWCYTCGAIFQIIDDSETYYPVGKKPKDLTTIQEMNDFEGEEAW
jgi:hypothetical protein